MISLMFILSLLGLKEAFALETVQVVQFVFMKIGSEETF